MIFEGTKNGGLKAVFKYVVSCMDREVVKKYYFQFRSYFVLGAVISQTDQS